MGKHDHPQAVNIAMLDANHCPGSSMFLIYSLTPPYRSILHTGDIRADAPFCQQLVRHPLVQPFLYRYPVASLADNVQNVSSQTERRVQGTCSPLTNSRLDRIYLDTSCWTGSGGIPLRETSISRLLDLMVRYPTDYFFHLDCWTFGYEEVLKAIARVFGTQIHLDRWKHQNMTSMEHDPMLQQMGTWSRGHETRFHACEFANPCTVLLDRPDKVVRVEFVGEGKSARHVDTMVTRTEQQVHAATMGQADWPNRLVSPRWAMNRNFAIVARKLNVVAHTTTAMSSCPSHVRPRTPVSRLAVQAQNHLS